MIESSSNLIWSKIMPLVGVRAKVESSDKWKEEFKTHGELFKSQGVSIAYMGATDNNSVLAIFETDDLDKFNEIFTSEETAKAMSNDGIEEDSVEMFVITDQLVIM